PGPELNPRRSLDEHFLAEKKIAHGVGRIVRRVLWKKRSARVRETALSDRLPGRRVRCQAKNEHHNRAPRWHYWRRIACSVKSSSLRATLYSSLSSVRRVRLPRRRSAISICRAVQMPCTLRMS